MSASGIGRLLLIEKARGFCVAAHEAIGQTRKYTGEPYWQHPVAVARLVKHSRDNGEEVICAAYLHDVLEDTQVRRETLTTEFGEEIAELVAWVTKVTKGRHDLTRHARHLLECEHIRRAPPAAKTIKLADIVDNCATISERAPEFAKTYLREKRELLIHCVDGDPELMRSAHEIIHRGLSS